MVCFLHFKAFNALMTGEETPALCKKRRTKFKELVSGVCGVSHQ